MEDIFGRSFTPFNKVNKVEIGKKSSSKQSKDDPWGIAKLLMSDYCCSCHTYTDEYINIWIRIDHKVIGPKAYCRACFEKKINSKESFDYILKKERNEGKRVIVRLDKQQALEKKRAMEKEMNLYRRKSE